jgi:hypothetical protein
VSLTKNRIEVDETVLPQLFCCGRTTVSGAFVVVLLLFLERAMLNPT